MTYNVDFGWNSKIFYTFLKIYCKLSGFGILNTFFHKFWLDLECLNCWFWLEFQNLPHLFYIVFLKIVWIWNDRTHWNLVGIPKSSTGGVWISNGIAHLTPIRIIIMHELLLRKYGTNISRSNFLKVVKENFGLELLPDGINMGTSYLVRGWGLILLIFFF